MCEDPENDNVGIGNNRVGMSSRLKAVIFVLTITLAMLWNHRFRDIASYSREQVFAMNDIASIVQGYRETPNLWVDGLRWWHGEWIQKGIPTFRPLSSYLYWIETHLGLTFGFIWPSWIGFLFFVVNCLLSSALAWRLTESRLAAIAAAVLATSVRYQNTGQPSEWIAWYPGHQELLMNGLLLGALLCFDIWFRDGSRGHLYGSWFLFILGCLAKETVYVFPLFAFAVCLFRRGNARTSLRQGLLQTGVMVAAVLVLWIYRSCVILHPRNPTLRINQVIYKPGLFIFNVFGRYLFQRIRLSREAYQDIFFSKDAWFPGLALLIFLVIAAIVKTRHSRPHAWYSRLYLIVPCSLVIITLYLLIASPSPATAFWLVFDHPFRQPGLRDLLTMVFTFYWLYLLWRYRETEPTLAAFAFLYIIHLPALDFIGWHYTLSPGFIWSGFWPFVWKLIWLNCKGCLPSKWLHGMEVTATKFRL